jgi:hypothetical protein
MALVLFHSGGKLPKYLGCTFRQIRLFNPNMEVYFITDRQLTRNVIFKKYKIIPVDKDFFYSDKIEKFEKVYGRKSSDFWTITATRLIYIENFIRARRLTDVYYFENDVLLYYDLQEYHKTFVDIYENLAITTGGETKCMTGFLFIKNWKSMAMMTQFFIDILTNYGMNTIIDRYKIEMVHEMSLMRIYGVEKGINYLANIPSLPYCCEFVLFNSLFDPAAWGQYVGGTNAEGPGAKPLDHYISQHLIEHPEYDVIWKTDEKNRKIPYFKYEDKEVKINNLHIHSKKLHKYISV